MRTMVRVLVFCIAIFTGGSAGAQSYPNHPVRMVVGFTAGGPTDVIARIVAEKLSSSCCRQW